KDIPGVENVSLIAGFSLLNGQGSNHGLGFVKLEDFSKRQEDSKSVKAITGKLFRAAATIPGANILFFAPPSIPGYGASDGFSVNLLDKSGGSFDKLSQVKNRFLMKLMKRPEILYA